MATLPDLDPANLRHIAFYNYKEEQGLDDSGWSPSDFTAPGRVEEFTLYDNGVEGSYLIGEAFRDREGKGGPNVYINYRVKDDGWIIAYVDNNDDYYGQTSFGSDSVVDTNAPAVGAYNYYGIGIAKGSDIDRVNIFDVLVSLIEESGYTDPSAPSESIGNYFGFYSYDNESAANVTLITNPGSDISFSYTDTVTLYEMSGTFGQGYGNALIADDPAIIPDNDEIGLGVFEMVNQKGDSLTYNISTSPNTKHDITPGNFDQGGVVLSIWG